MNFYVWPQRNVSSPNLIANVEQLSSLHSRHVNSGIVSMAAERIFAAFQAVGGRINVGYGEFELDYDDVTTTQRNVIARLPGSDPNAGVIVLGAHYDSRTDDLPDSQNRAPGANDNATGVAALIEIARLLANETPIASIDFVMADVDR